MNSILESYNIRVAEGRIQADRDQHAAVGELEMLASRIKDGSRDSSLIKGIFSRKTNSNVKGLYIWGSVGCGKSMLMDMFYEKAPIERKSRVHFLEFMQSVHSSLHEVRKTGVSDAIPPVAKEISVNSRLLCLDEMQIEDIADAMIVGRLFACLFDSGVAICTTANKAPERLYENGLNRNLFLPFIDLLHEKMTVHRLAGETDYRQNRIMGERKYFSPANDSANQEMDRIWLALAGGEPKTLVLKVTGREVGISRFRNGVARASFWELCGQPLGPGDYLELAKYVRVLMLDEIPILSRSNYNEARRFIMLIDALYDSGVELFASADAEPDKLYIEGEGAFAFQRTVSRLQEMQSFGWGESETRSMA